MTDRSPRDTMNMHEQSDDCKQGSVAGAMGRLSEIYSQELTERNRNED